MGKTVEQLRTEQSANIENTPIFSKGLRAMLERLLLDCDIDKAKRMFSCNRDKALEAIAQYNTETHEIKNRPDKKRVDQDDFPTCKLSCAIQKRTNSVSTHFMFGNKIKFSLANKHSELEELRPYFDKFLDFVDSVYFHERLYKARQIAGSETECAKLYTLYKDEDGKSEVICQIKANSLGDTLYPLFNQYGKMVAFAIGYFLRDEEFRNEEHFDVYTSKKIWKFKKSSTIHMKGWEKLECEDNPFQKIPVIYYNHELDWEGAQDKIERLEWIISKNGDTNEYFGNPYLLISPELAENRLADAREVGKVLVADPEGRFEFVAPPDCGEMIENEKNELNASIERDTLTPDWTYKSIMGLGTLSAKAMRQINISGYVKRDRLAVQVYNELITREINLMLSIMTRYVYLDDTDTIKGLMRLLVRFAYTDPFAGSLDDNSTEVSTYMGAGAMSIESAVKANHYIEDKEAEVERIWKDLERKALIEARAKATIEKDNKDEETEKSKINTEEAEK